MAKKLHDYFGYSTDGDVFVLEGKIMEIESFMERRELLQRIIAVAYLATNEPVRAEEVSNSHDYANTYKLLGFVDPSFILIPYHDNFRQEDIKKDVNKLIEKLMDAELIDESHYPDVEMMFQIFGKIPTIEELVNE